MTEQVLNRYLVEVGQIREIQDPSSRASALYVVAVAAARDREGLSIGEYTQLKLKLVEELKKVGGSLGTRCE